MRMRQAAQLHNGDEVVILRGAHKGLVVRVLTNDPSKHEIEAVDAANRYYTLEYRVIH